MAYEEPGVTVIQEPVAEAAVVQSEVQSLTLVGPLYELHEDEEAVEKYSALVGAGAQDVNWPKDAATSVVDLAGVRKSTAEPDSQLLEAAEYPMSVSLRDPVTGVSSAVDLIADVSAVDQTKFTLAEGSSAAVARVNSAIATAAEVGKVRLAAGGFVAAGVAIGDRVRVSNGGALDTLATITAFTDDEITYSTTPADVDAAALTGSEGDGRVSGEFEDIAGAPVAFTGKEGSRLVVYVEETEVDDGSTPGGGNTVATTTLNLSASDIGRKATIHSSDAGDGAVTDTDGDADTPGANVLSSVAAAFTAAMLGNVIKIGSSYRRIVRFVSATQVEYSGALISGTGITWIVYAPLVRNITDVQNSGKDIVVDGAVLAAGTDLPVVIHRAERRDILTVESATKVTYNGNAFASDTGFLLKLPFETFDDDVTLQVFPDYEVLVTFRALDVTSLDEPIRLSAPSEVSALGTIHKNNDLLFAAQAALTAMGTTDTEILLMPVDLWANDDPRLGFPEDQDVLLGFQEATEVLDALDEPYFLVPLTKNAAVRDHFDSNVDAQSDEEEKHERIVALSYNLPMGEYESISGVISPGESGGNKRITETGAGFITTHGLTPGKSVVILFPAAFAGTYTVSSGSTDDVLELAGDNWAQDSLGVYEAAFKEFEVTDASFGGQSGAGASIASILAGEMTITGLTDMSDVDVGRNIVITGAATGANNGTFPITEVVSPTSVKYTNLSGVAPDANNPSIGWSVTPDGRVGSQTSEAWKDVEVGDYILNGTATRKVTAVSANFRELTLEGALFSGVSQTIQVLRSYDPTNGNGVNYYADPLSKSEQASALEAISVARANRRVVHLWPETVPMVTGSDQQGNDVIEQVEAYFGAAAVFAQKSVLPAQRSNTGLQVPGLVGELQSSSRYFKRSELNTIANGGWTILEQRQKNGPVTVRHLMSTDRSAEKFQEVSITTNVDAISKDARLTMEPLLTDSKGRINISKDYLTFLKMAWDSFLRSQKDLSRLIDTEDAQAFQIKSFETSGTADSKIVTRTALTVPFPANNLEITLEF